MRNAIARGALPALAIAALSGCIPAGAPDHSPPRPVSPAPGQPAPRTPVPTQDKGDGVTAIPAPPAAWEARGATATARTIATSSYVVERGDTLRGIANKTGAGSDAIARANGLAPPFTIQVGQRLTIPGGRYHLVREGETGIAIARAYGINWANVVTANALEEPYILRAGQRILIPGDAVPRTVAERAAAFRIDIDDILTGGEPAIEPDERPARAAASPTRVLPTTAAVAAPVRLSSGFQWPVQGKVLKRFGAGGSGERNDGIKIGVPMETPVQAAADGVVAYAGTGVPGLGGVVILKHGASITTVYGHASELLVQRGQSVKRGQLIARSGDSGYADRPQLHFEMRDGRRPVDPATRLPKL